MLDGNVTTRWCGGGQLEIRIDPPETIGGFRVVTPDARRVRLDGIEGERRARPAINLRPDAIRALRHAGLTCIAVQPGTGAAGELARQMIERLQDWGLEIAATEGPAYLLRHR